MYRRRQLSFETDVRFSDGNTHPVTSPDTERHSSISCKSPDERAALRMLSYYPDFKAAHEPQPDRPEPKPLAINPQPEAA
jgi:hypothetical protein